MPSRYCQTMMFIEDIIASHAHTYIEGAILNGLLSKALASLGPKFSVKANQKTPNAIVKLLREAI